MTKLYREQGLWVVPGSQGRGAERVDIPNSPEPLATWLNERDVAGHAQLTDERRIGDLELVGESEPFRATIGGHPKVAGRCDACGRSAEGALKLARGNELDAIGEWMDGLGHAEIWVLQALADRIREKAVELKGSIQ